MSKSQYVFVTSKSKMQVIDTAKSVAELQKRIPKKKNPYPEDVAVLRVDKDRILKMSLYSVWIKIVSFIIWKLKNMKMLHSLIMH